MGAAQDKLTDLGKRHGWDFVWCIVARAKSDAMALGSDGSGENGQIMLNADRWLEQ